MPKYRLEFENTSAFLLSLTPAMHHHLSAHYEEQFGVSRDDYHFMIDHRNDAVVVVTAVPKKKAPADANGGSSS